MLRVRIGSAAAIAGFAVAVACAAPQPGTAPQRGGTVVIALGAEPATLMPYSNDLMVQSNVLSFMFTYLADTDSTLMGAVPTLAESWEWSPDRLALTMHLQPNAAWSDGVPVTAEDVAFTFDVQRDTVINWRSRHWKNDITACEVVDPHTVRFRFTHDFPDALRYAKEGFILPKHLLAGVPRRDWARAAFANQPVGCGPFQLERWERQQRIVLVRNPHYFAAGKPYVDRVVFEILPDAQGQVTQLRAGRVDFVEDLPPRDALALQKQQAQPGARVRVDVHRGRTYDYIGYNLADPLFAAREVREALTRGIDRQALVARVRLGFGEVFEGPIAPPVWACDTSRLPTPYDPEGARRLLAAAGWRDSDRDGWLDRDGQRFTFDLLVPSENPRRVDAAVWVQSAWKALGVDAQIVRVEAVKLGEQRKKHDFRAYIGSWGSGLSPNLAGIWGCQGASNNFVGYCNPRVDSLNARALLLQPAAARPLWVEAQRLIVADHPYTWLYYLQDTNGISTRLRDVQLDHRGPYNNPDSWWIATP